MAQDSQVEKSFSLGLTIVVIIAVFIIIFAKVADWGKTMPADVDSIRDQVEDQRD